MPKKTPETFEQNLHELETLIGQLEKGEMSLDESLKQFERGISLAKSCQTILKNAEQKIEVLTNKSENAHAETFSDAIDDDDA